MAQIYAALAAVQAEIGAVAKNNKNTHQHFMYRGIDDVLNEVGPALRKHKVFVIPDDSEVTITSHPERNVEIAQLAVTYKFFAEDGSHVSATVHAEAYDSFDKALSKAWSIALRTCLLQTFCIPTGEPDPDSESYEAVPPAAPVKKTQPAKRAVRSQSRASVAELKRIVVDAFGGDIVEASKWWNDHAAEITAGDDPTETLRTLLEKR